MKRIILLIEDDKVDQLAFERLVKAETLPYDYIIVESVSEAKKILNDQTVRFDVILVDNHLGDGTAFDICDSFNVIDPPVIFVTGTGDQETAVKALKSGAYDYLIKDPTRNYLKVLAVTIENAIKRRNADEQVRMLSHAVMSTHDGVYITNMAGEIVFVNKSFCQTYGYEEAEILGKNYRLLQDSLRGDAKQKKISTGQLKISEIIHKRKDGSTFPISLSTSMIKDDNKRGVALVSVVRDISERKQAEAQREKLIAELQESLAKVKRLKGLLPICASCKNIRNDQGYWQEVEVYIREHAEVDFSHGICPDCTAKLYPDIYQKSLERKQDIVNALNELKRADLTAISAAVGLPESNTENRLRDMVKAGTVKCLELSGRTFYELPKG